MILRSKNLELFFSGRIDEARTDADQFALNVLPGHAMDMPVHKYVIRGLRMTLDCYLRFKPGGGVISAIIRVAKMKVIAARGLIMTFRHEKRLAWIRNTDATGVVA